MKLSDGQKDVLEDLLKHSGFDVVEEVARRESERLMDSLAQYGTDVDKTNRCRGELKGLAYLSRKSLENLIRDTP